MAHLFRGADRVFLREFRGASLPFSEWTHQSHVRLGFLTVWESNFQFHPSLESIKRDIQHFNSFHTAKLSVGFHETMTHFWVHSIFLRAAAHGPIAFQSFWEREPILRDTKLWEQFYSRHLMFSSRAKTEIVTPDIKGLPLLPRASSRDP
jgi:hypothetical protein